MKKGYLTLLGITLISATSAFAQTQLVNGNMELWDNPSGNTAEPQEWNSNKTGTGFANLGPQTLFREASIVHSGTYSARIKTSTYFGTTVNGVMTCGQVNAPSTTPSQGYNSTVQANAAFNMPITAHPDSLVFWAYYTPGAGDLARASASLHQAYDQRDPYSNDPNGSTNVIAQAALQFGSTSAAWQRISVPFDYATFNNNNAPAYVLITFTSSYQPGSGSTTSTLYIDDVELVYNPVLTTGVVSPLQYYVTANSGVAIDMPFTLIGNMNAANLVNAELSDATGSFASPFTLGSLNTVTSGTVNGVIPSGTASGTAYRVRATSTDYPLTAVDNGSDIEIILAANSVAPATSQTIEAGVDGSLLTVTQTSGSTEQRWRVATTSGGPYALIPGAIDVTYTPNFVTPGVYFVLCETIYPGGVPAESNEVQINVVDNSIAPASPQSLLIGIAGTMLSVTESLPASAREWKFATVSGGPYSSFLPTETNSDYTPLFNTPGTYFVVCESQISGITVTSNEVIISVGSVTLSTGTILGSPFEFSPSAPNASVNVPYTVSTQLNLGNTFTAQLSNASGSFASPTDIGTLVSQDNGTISATIPSNTPSGTAYRIRVISDSPAILGSDNGVDLVINQFSNSVAPAGAQNIGVGVNGTLLTVNESQNASSRNWKFSTTSGGPYSDFVPAETGATYTPNFAAQGTYFVICESFNQYNDGVTSNEVIINVANGTNLNTSSVAGSPYFVSASSNVTVNVDFTTNIAFDVSNVFTAELSNSTGSFAAPVSIGTLNGATPGTINAVIPGNTSNGNGYRIRVVSSSPAFVGTDNGTDLTAIQFENSIAPPDSQTIGIGSNGTIMTATETHPGATREWKFRNSPFVPYGSFTPAVTGTTYTPNFATSGTKYVTCYSVNSWGDTTQSQEVVIIVKDMGFEENESALAQVYISNGSVMVDLRNTEFKNPLFKMMDMSGKIISERKLYGTTLHSFEVSLPSGIYLCTLDEGNLSKRIKLFIK